MLGLFDTVASVIESGRFGPRLKSHAFTSRNTSVESVSHAVAIDERRTMFRPQLWPAGQEYWSNPFSKAPAKPQDAKEVWFAGGHGDIGGGYAERESGLCKVPLVWMIARARSCGLKFGIRNVNKVVLGKGKNSKYVAPDPLAGSHNTMTPTWSVLEFVPRRKPKDSPRPSLLGLVLPLFERRTIPAGASIHRTVIERREKIGRWAPNVPEDHQFES